MSGLEARLREVEGVSAIQLELGDDGLETIRVRMDEASEETEVLEQIRKILVAYGLRARRPHRSPGRGDTSEVVDLEQLALSASEHQSGRDVDEVHIGPAPGGLEVRLVGRGRAVIRRAAATPFGAGEAMAAAVAAWRGVPEPAVVTVEQVTTDNHRAVTVVLDRGGDGMGAGAAVDRRGLSWALYRAVVRAFEDI